MRQRLEHTETMVRRETFDRRQVVSDETPVVVSHLSNQVVDEGLLQQAHCILPNMSRTN